MWRVGDQCYFLETYTVVPGVITRISGDFCVVKYGDGKGIRLRSSRLYKTVDEAEAVAASRRPKPPEKRRSNPYMYDH